MSAFLFGEHELPDGSEWSGGSSSSECQILATPASCKHWIDKIVIRRPKGSVGEIKLSVSAFSVETSWSGDKASRVGLVSTAALSEKSNAPQLVILQPPLKMDSGQYVGIWDADGRVLDLRYCWRRALVVAHKGFWVCRRPAGVTPLTRWHRCATSWYALGTLEQPLPGPPSAGSSAGKAMAADFSLYAIPIIRDCNESEQREKREVLERQAEPVEEILVD